MPDGGIRDDLHGCPERAAAREDRQAGEETLLVFLRRSSWRPFDGCAEGAAGAREVIVRAAGAAGAGVARGARGFVWVESAFTRAAASSSARGRSSRRRQISGTASSAGEVGSTAARSCQEEADALLVHEGRHRVLLLARDVERLAARRQAARSLGQEASEGGEPRRRPPHMSKLSKRKSRRGRRCARRGRSWIRGPAPPSPARARVMQRRSGIPPDSVRVIGREPAACSARRVLPVPPGPVSVSRRTSARRSSPATESTSLSRPMKAVDGHGQIHPVKRSDPREVTDAELVDPLGGRQILESMIAEVDQLDRSATAAVDVERRTCPPLPAAAIRAARWTSSPT